MAFGDSVLVDQKGGGSYGRDSRLRCQSQFMAVRNGGHSYAGRYCVVNILIPPPDNIRKAAFTISRKYSKLAVERNRARRLFREVYRRIYDRLPVSWVIFIPRHRMLNAKMDDVLADVEGCLSVVFPSVFSLSQ